MLSKQIISRLSHYLEHIKFKNGIYCFDLGNFVEERVETPHLNYHYYKNIIEEKKIYDFLHSIHPEPDIILTNLSSIIFIYGYDNIKWIAESNCNWYGNVDNIIILLNFIKSIFHRYCLNLMYSESLAIYQYHKCKWDSILYSIFVAKSRVPYLSDRDIFFPYNKVSNLQTLCKSTFVMLLCKHVTKSIHNK